jgi:hypothetical protein
MPKHDKLATKLVKMTLERVTTLAFKIFSVEHTPGPGSSNTFSFNKQLNYKSIFELAQVILLQPLWIPPTTRNPEYVTDLSQFKTWRWNSMKYQNMEAIS